MTNKEDELLKFIDLHIAEEGVKAELKALIEAYTIEEVEAALENTPDCDACERIDPYNPPERYNEGYL